MIYLDANSSSRCRPEVVSYVEHLLKDAVCPLNPSSIHQAGRKARQVVLEARKHLETLLFPGGNVAGDIVFTSGATEACNAAILGAIHEVSDHIVCSRIEHPAVIEPVRILESRGHGVSWISANTDGFVSADQMVNATTSETRLVCLMAANNETGAVQPVVELAKKLRSKGFKGVLFVDYTQALGKTKLSVGELFDSGVSAVSLSGHKVGAFTGVGALVVNTLPDFKPDLRSFVVGGPQEKGKRAGTENVPGIASFGEVARILRTQNADKLDFLENLRESLWHKLEVTEPRIFRLTPAGDRSLVNTLLVSFENCRGDDMVVALDVNGLCASFGSACSTGKQEVSHVLAAMGLSPEKSRGAIRFSLDWDATEEMINEAVRIIVDTVRQMRN